MAGSRALFTLKLLWHGRDFDISRHISPLKLSSATFFVSIPLKGLKYRLKWLALG